LSSCSKKSKNAFRMLLIPFLLFLLFIYLRKRVDHLR